MRVLTTPAQLEAFLDEERGFADAFAFEIEPRATAGASPPDRVAFRVRYQSRGPYVAGEIRTMRAFGFVATGVTAWTFTDATEWYPPHCMQSIDALDVAPQIGVEMDLPERVHLVCREITVSDPHEYEERIPPFLGRGWSCEIHGGTPPSPREWLAAMRVHDADLHWHDYGGGATDADAVPTPYTGWYLGRLGDGGRPVEPGPVLFFAGVRASEDAWSVSIECDDPALREAASRFLVDRGDGAVRTGNCVLTVVEWRAYLDSHALPARCG